MYHDQALIPIKTLAFWDGVNVTLGLPIVRTSPDHGTALDIAGKGKADARSMIAAIQHGGDDGRCRALLMPTLAAAARGHRGAWPDGEKIARPELPARSQSHRAASRAPPGRSTATTIYEVGPGPGGLTRALLAEGAARVIAVERDERCLPALEEIAARYPGRLDVIAAMRWRSTRRRSAARGAVAHRRQPALQYRHRAAGEMADDAKPGRRSGRA